MTVGTIFTALSYLTGLAVFYWSAKDRKFPTNKIFALAFCGLIGGILGAKIMRWLADWQLLSGNPGAILDPQFGGRTIVGGILFGWLAVEIAKRYMNIKRSTGDSFALALSAGEFIGRIGCFFNGCCYGTVTTLPWAVYQHNAWRHPAQIYSSITALAIFIVLLYLRKKLTREGDLFRLYLLFYGAARFCLEFLRERNNIYWGLSMTQWICFEIVIAMLITFLILNYMHLGQTKREADVGS